MFSNMPINIPMLLLLLMTSNLVHTKVQTIRSTRFYLASSLPPKLVKNILYSEKTKTNAMRIVRYNLHRNITNGFGEIYPSST